MEHLIPFVAGGTSTLENLALACFASAGFCESWHRLPIRMTIRR